MSNGEAKAEQSTTGETLPEWERHILRWGRRGEAVAGISAGIAVLVLAFNFIFPYAKIVLPYRGFVISAGMLVGNILMLGAYVELFVFGNADRSKRLYRISFRYFLVPFLCFSVALSAMLGTNDTADFPNVQFWITICNLLCGFGMMTMFFTALIIPKVRYIENAINAAAVQPAINKAVIDSINEIDKYQLFLSEMLHNIMGILNEKSQASGEQAKAIAFIATTMQETIAKQLAVLKEVADKNTLTQTQPAKKPATKRKNSTRRKKS